MIAMYDAHGYLVWTLLGIIFFLRSFIKIGEVIGFSLLLFRATGLAFNIFKVHCTTPRPSCRDPDSICCVRAPVSLYHHVGTLTP